MTTKLVAVWVALVVVLVFDHKHQAGAIPSPSSMVSCAKEYMIGLVKDKVINRSQLMSSFNGAMERVRVRYQEAEASGELAGKDEADCSAFRYKLMIDELRQLRSSFESGQIKVQAADDVETPEDKLIASCAGVSDDVDKKTTAGWSPDAIGEADDEAELELELMSQLDDLERQAMGEDEMGLSLTPEVKDQLKKRTKLVLMDLLNNEIRQLALSVLSAYMTGGPLMGVITAMSGTLKFKLVEFLMNGAMDVLGSMMGRPIEIKPLEEIKPAPYQEITADELLAHANLAN